jgi:hypothetical protein
MKFFVKPHDVLPDKEMVEVFDNGGAFVAAIYANDDATILRVVSKHLADVMFDNAKPPSALVSLTSKRTLT